MEIAYLGHATLLIETLGKRIIVDPFLTENPLAQVGPEEIKADFMLITHAHGDHVGDVEKVAAHNDLLLISNYEIVTHYQKSGINGHPLNHGGKNSFDFGTAKYVNAVHSSFFFDGTNGGNPGGFVLWNEEGCVYIAGDTALTEDMKLIPLTCPKLDLAVLPIGDNFTMGYEDAVHAANFVQCDRVMGYHYNSYPPIQIDATAAINHFANSGKTLELPKVGGSISF